MLHRKLKIILIPVLLIIASGLIILASAKKNPTEAGELSLVPETATHMSAPPTETSAPTTTSTDTPLPPTDTPVPTPIPATDTPAPTGTARPSATSTATATETSTATPLPPTDTPMPVVLPNEFEDRSEDFDWVIDSQLYGLLMNWLNAQHPDGERLLQVRFILVDGGKASEPLVQIQGNDSYDLYLGSMYPNDWYNKESLAMVSCVGETSDLRCYVSLVEGNAQSAGANICMVKAMAQALDYWYTANINHKIMQYVVDNEAYQPLITQNGDVWRSNHLKLQ